MLNMMMRNDCHETKKIKRVFVKEILNKNMHTFVVDDDQRRRCRNGEDKSQMREMIWKDVMVIKETSDKNIKESNWEILKLEWWFY